MKAITVIQPNKAKILEVAIPQIEFSDQVLVRIRATGICGSDVHVLHGRNPYAKYPRVIGHEASGVIVAVGTAVTDLVPGDGVVFEPILYCSECYACRNGHHNVCRNLQVLGCTFDGTFREFVVARRSQVYKFNTNSMSYVQAAVCEPYTIGFQAIWRGNVHAEDIVLVHGAGPIGLILCDVAKSKGASVIVSEPIENRLSLAEDFGADYLVNPEKDDLHGLIDRITHGEGVNVVFEAAGIPSLIQDAITILSPAGRFVPMTFGKDPIAIDFKAINAKELTIAGTRHQYQKFPEVLSILPSRLDKVDKLITHIFPVIEFEKAFATLADKNSHAAKVVLTF